MPLNAKRRETGKYRHARGRIECHSRQRLPQQYAHGEHRTNAMRCSFHVQLPGRRIVCSNEVVRGTMWRMALSEFWWGGVRGHRRAAIHDHMERDFSMQAKQSQQAQCVF